MLKFWNFITKNKNKIKEEGKTFQLTVDLIITLYCTKMKYSCLLRNSKSFPDTNGSFHLLAQVHYKKLNL